MRKILIIEDEPLTGRLYGDKYRAEGCEVALAGSGAAAEKLVGVGFHPDFIQLDLMLPRENGLVVLRRLREAPALRAVPIVVLTSMNNPEVVREAREAGANLCLTKANCSPTRMLAVIRDLLPAAAAPRPEDLRAAFLQTAPEALAECRALAATLLQVSEPTQGLEPLGRLQEKAHSLAVRAGASALPRAAQAFGVLADLLRELRENFDINPGTLNTVGQALEFLAARLVPGANPEPAAPRQPSVLVVDDEAISRRAATHVLDKLGMKFVALAEPQTALDLLGSSRFDLLFLDVDMPGMTGVELWRRLRDLPRNAATPVIFTTFLSYYDPEMKPILDVGGDVLSKPYLFDELALKALVRTFDAQ